MWNPDLGRSLKGPDPGGGTLASAAVRDSGGKLNVRNPILVYARPFTGTASVGGRSMWR